MVIYPNRTEKKSNCSEPKFFKYPNGYYITISELTEIELNQTETERLTKYLGLWIIITRDGCGWATTSQLEILTKNEQNKGIILYMTQD